MTALDRWVWAGVLGWVAAVGAGPWVLGWSGPHDPPIQEYLAAVAASALVLGVVLGRIRAWRPCVAAGIGGVAALVAASGAFGLPILLFFDPTGYLEVVGLLFGMLVVDLPMLMGAFVGHLLRPVADPCADPDVD
ncbi:hypothetical protein GCM10010441_69880 [Kitasatospora paracochleata]|uniref:Histidinol dehydrogenase n=1 Tax=Kitasatospora paracochleata TaxID=58354 RepID=A0ABT1JB97_9ACTN|nr:hypothetical protein [Kitasatospora paracochleata]MCP2314353.1 hypothetical protein [Kitasatospora paracochleata]